MKTSDKLEVMYKLIGDIKPYPNNPRRNDDAVEAVAHSIEKFGWQQPIVVDKDGVIIVGHTRLKAAYYLGLEKVPVVYADLTEDEANAYRLADNKTGELAEWDFGLLDVELGNIIDIDMTEFGFDVSFDEDEPVEIIEDEIPEEVETKCKSGELWQLGKHRLICGDSTDPETIAKLTGGKRINICFTSPPYNMGCGEFTSTPNPSMNGGKAYGEFSDDLNDDEYSDLLCKSMRNALEYCDDVLYNIGILQNSKQGIINLLDEFRYNFLDVVVWNKERSFPLGMKNQGGMLSHRCELIFCFNQKGNRSFTWPQWEIGTGINRIDSANASQNEYAKEHAATFPVEFAAKVVEMFSSESVMDLFGGTGTTLIAAEQLGRSCYMSELDPHYCDIIIQRWEDFTGEKAIRI